MSLSAVRARTPVVRTRSEPDRQPILRSLALPTLGIAAVTAWLAWQGWAPLSGYQPLHAIRDGQVQLAGPVVLGFVLLVFVIEQFAPAEPRCVLARGRGADRRCRTTHPDRAIQRATTVLAHVPHAVDATLHHQPGVHV